MRAWIGIFLLFWTSSVFADYLVTNTVFEVGGQKILFTNYVDCYASGKVKKGEMAEATVVAGLKFNGSPDAISFYESGRVESGWLSEPVTVQGITFTNRTLSFIPRAR